MKLDMKDIKDNGNCVIIRIPETKTAHFREFKITEGEFPDINLLAIFRKYAALRPPIATTTRFFLCYSNGRCLKQPIGINTLAKFPHRVAEFLGLENPELYTGHSFRRTSALLLAETTSDNAFSPRQTGFKLLRSQSLEPADNQPAAAKKRKKQETTVFSESFTNPSVEVVQKSAFGSPVKIRALKDKFFTASSSDDV